MIPHDILNCAIRSRNLPRIDISLEQQLLHSYNVYEQKTKEEAERRRKRIAQHELQVEEQILREIHQKEEAQRIKRQQEEEALRIKKQKEEEEKQRQMELQRQQQLQREREEQEKQRQIELQRQQQIQRENELIELRRRQAEENARIEALRKQQEAQEARRREQEELRRREQEFVDQLMLMETTKLSRDTDAPPPYRPSNGSYSQSNDILLDLPPPTPLVDPFIQQFVSQGCDPDLVNEAMRICGRDAQNIWGYMGEYNFYQSHNITNRGFNCSRFAYFWNK